jgi:signal transduction histidine kinase/DNA-binding response OmpR family regulator/ligand-binding sensor domain-containing protein
LGQQKTYNFTHYTIEEGLAHNHCYAMIQDSMGFIWVATENGLSRFDGHEFINYRNDETDTNSIGGNWVRSLVYGKKGKVWAGNMRGGINRYNPELDNFFNVDLASEDKFGLATKELTNIYGDSDDNIWFGTFREGFGKYDPNSNTISNYTFGHEYESPRQAWSENSVFAFCEDIEDSNFLWVSRKCELYRFDKTKEELEFISRFEPASMRSSSIHKLYMEKAGELWVGFWGSGLARYNIDNKEWSHFPYDINKFKEGDGYSNVCLDIEKKSDHEFWLAAGLDGLGVFDRNAEEFKFFELPNAFNPDIKSGFAYDVYLDKNNTAWICDQINGLYHLDPSRQLFTHISTKIQEEGSRAGLNRPLDFAFDPQSSLYYVATGQGDGLYVYDKAFNLVHTAPSSVPTQYSYHQFVDVHVDKKSNVWVIDWLKNKLLKYNQAKKLCIPVEIEKFEAYPDKKFTFSQIREDESGNLWISSYYGGLFKFNPSQNTLERFAGSDPTTELPENAQIEAIHIANDGKIWLGTLNYGVYIFDPISQTFKTYPYHGGSLTGLIEDRVHGISQDKFGNIWIGFYTKGIQIIDPEKGADQKQKRLNSKNGLTNEQVLDIQKDAMGNMWVQTQGGVFKYDHETSRFRHFTQREGLTGYLKPSGFEIIQDGTLCVGGSEGFYVMRPGEEYVNQFPPNVKITGFDIGGQTNPKNTRVDFSKQIKLAFKDNFFTIYFSALNFQLPEKNEYMYKLNGVDQDWVKNGSKYHASYTDIKEGSYLFEVKAANNDGIWARESTILSIYIAPPWYRSLLAYLVYTLLGASLLAMVYRIQKKRWELKTQLKLKAEEAKQLKELDKVKSSIYTNITHEFRTPLTVIQGMVKNIIRDPHSKLEERIMVIKRNSKSLLQLINQMLELSKLEGGYLKVDLVHDDIIKYLAYLTESFHSFANDKGIHLNFHAEKAPVLMDYDPEKIERILGNLLSNALKFTQEYGSVLVIARTQFKNNKQYLELEIKDSGKGISKKDLEHIFDRFYQADGSETRKAGGTGIGLALVNELVRSQNGWVDVKSEPGKGSSFKVYLPIEKKARDKHLIASDEISELRKEKEVVLEMNNPHTDLTSEKPRLLIIEDNEDVVYYLESFLMQEFLITKARNGLEGIEKALAILPDIIISDVMMPEKDGFEVCNTLKNNMITSHIPIVILTAKASDKDMISGIKKGADAYMMKPFSEEVLLAQLKSLLENRKQLRAHYASYLQHKKVLDKESRSEAEFVDKIIQIIEENLSNESFDTMKLCQKIGMSRSQLHRKTKALLDTTPALYIRLLRLEKAKSFLKNTDKTISEIAFETGFKSPSYFTYSFSETFGTSPSAFRNEA